MSSWLLKGMMAATIALPAVSGVARADDFGCSNATLHGEYAFGVTNYVGNPTVVVAGIKVFDGNGNLTQRDYGGDAVPAQFSPASGPNQETGTYQVNSDCTGSMVIHLNAPVTSGSTGIINILFVLSNGGGHIHEVVSKLIPPGFPETESLPTQTSADDWKVASERDSR
jgi:hypothetical protein